MIDVILFFVFARDVADLKADDFQVRQCAEARLARWSSLSWRACDRRFDDLEQRRRARRVVRSEIPDTYPPIAVLTGRCIPEWRPCDSDYDTYRIGPRPNPGWMLSWLYPNKRSPLFFIVRHYGERTRTQSAFPDWHLDADGREATRLLVRDMLAAGVPVTAVRAMIDRMATLEARLADYRSAP
jgi:hypothetical protein